jgi:peroxiredoxin
MDGREGASMTLPEIGTPAPTFTLPTAGGTRIGLADYRGAKNVVLWFSKGLF